MRSGRAACITLFAVLVGSILGGPVVSRAQPAARTFVVEMVPGLRFVPDFLQAEPADVVTIVVFNNDTIGHTFDISEFNVHIGTIPIPLGPGRNDTRTFTADRAGTFWFFCAITGHAAQSGTGYTGMAGRLVVGQVPPPGDFTLFLVVGGVAAAAVVVGIAVWLRGRAPQT